MILILGWQLSRNAFSSAIRFAHKLTKKQTDFAPEIFNELLYKKNLDKSIQETDDQKRCVTFCLFGIF